MKRPLVLLIVAALFLPGCDPRMPQKPKTELAAAIGSTPQVAMTLT